MISVVVVGLGPIGQEIARRCWKNSQMKLVGGVDIDPKKSGQGLGGILGIKGCEAPIFSDLKLALDRLSPEAVILATSSRVDDILDDATTCLERGVNVVSTCEALTYPVGDNRSKIQDLDKIARENTASILGTGVNPGFLMDALPTYLARLSSQITRISIARIQDARPRRKPFRDKMGIGLTRPELEAQIGSGRLGHKGLRESAEMLVRGTGLGVERFEETVHPIVGPDDQIRGLFQSVLGWQGAEKRVELRFQATLDEAEPRNEVEISGDPDLKLRFETPVPGDSCTANMVVNMVGRVCEASPGFVTMTD